MNHQLGEREDNGGTQPDEQDEEGADCAAEGQQQLLTHRAPGEFHFGCARGGRRLHFARRSLCLSTAESPQARGGREMEKDASRELIGANSRQLLLINPMLPPINTPLPSAAFTCSVSHVVGMRTRVPSFG